MSGKIEIRRLRERWKRDYSFKTMLGALISFAATTLFALYNGYLGLSLRSVWHGGICVFYLLLVIIRGLILLAEKKALALSEDGGERLRRRSFITSSAMLLMLNLALILPISMMVLLEKPVSMGMIPAIAMAVYTTYKLTMASLHIGKKRRDRQSNVLIAQLRTINFIDALVSVLTLQNTLIMVSGSPDEFGDMRVLSSISGAAIYLAIVIISVRLLLKGIKENWCSLK